MRRQNQYLVPILAFLLGVCCCTFTCADELPYEIATSWVRLFTEQPIKIQAKPGCYMYTWSGSDKLKLQELSERCEITGPPGEHWVRVRALHIDWAKQEAKELTSTLVIRIAGDVPDDGEDEDDEDDETSDCDRVPADTFNDVGKRACQWVSLVGDASKRRALGEMYRDLSSVRMVQPQYRIFTNRDVNDYLRQKVPELLGDTFSDWAAWRRKLNEAAIDSGVTTFLQRRDFYTALANGLLMEGPPAKQVY